VPAKLNRPQNQGYLKMGMNLLSAVCRATGHKIKRTLTVLEQFASFFTTVKNKDDTHRTYHKKFLKS
jgi:hypothetical protein